MKTTVVLATKCWGGDYKRFLGDIFVEKSKVIGFPFKEEILVVNNEVPLEAVNALVLRNHCITTDHVIGGVSLYFSIPEEELKKLRKYTLGELSAIWSQRKGTRCEYLCFVQGDCITEGGDWVTPAIKVLENEPDVMVVSPASEVNTWHDKDGYDHYMSDQAFVVRVKDFLNPEVYKVEGVDPDYPAYGGNSFEHMVGKYLKHSGKKRKILTDFYVIHPAY